MNAENETPTAEQARIGNLVRRARKDLGLSQQAVADKAGVTRITVSRYENENWAIKFHFIDLVKIADALQISYQELFECIDGRPFKKPLSQRQKDAANVRKSLDKTRGLATEIQVSLILWKQMLQELQRTTKSFEKLLSTLKLGEEDEITSSSSEGAHSST